MNTRQKKKLHRKMMKRMDAPPQVRRATAARPTVIHKNKKKAGIDWFDQRFAEMISDSEERYNADKG